MLNALIIIVKTLTDLYLLMFLLRFLMQWVRASHYNPFAQFVFKVTSPLVIPARRVLPSVAGLDTPTLVVLVLLEILATWLLLWLARYALPVPEILFYSLLRLIALTLWFYTVAIFVYALVSWFGNPGRNPMFGLLGQLIDPVLRPARRLLPPISGFDFSPIIVLVLLEAAATLLPLLPGLR